MRDQYKRTENDKSAKPMRVLNDFVHLKRVALLVVLVVVVVVAGDV